MSNTVGTSYEVQAPQQSAVHWILRAAYFLLFGLWFSGIWAAIAWVLCVTIIGLPVGLWMLHKLPQITTLRPEQHHYVVSPSGHLYERELPQPPFVLRALYFLLVGWWLSALWLTLAWALSAIIIGLPIAFWMINRTPAVMTLARQ
jgi:uncharacterized membrane protein YccF (DUF307 family)